MRGVGIQIDNDYALAVRTTRGADGKLQGLEPGLTTNQNTAMILTHDMGQFKDEPALGVGLHHALLDHDLAGWRRKIRLALELDGQRVSDVVFTENQLEIDAAYNS